MIQDKGSISGGAVDRKQGVVGTGQDAVCICIARRRAEQDTGHKE